jgi:hypothetical protein
MKIEYLQTLKKLFVIYFTAFPYHLYNISNQASNFGLVGVSYTLIYAQQKFWFANIGSIIFIYNIKNIDYFYLNMAILGFTIYLYTVSFAKTICVLKYL